MSMEAVLQFFMAHNQAITNWLFVAVLILSALVAVFTLLRPRQAEGGGSGASAKELEVALRKVMDEKIPAGGVVASSAPAPIVHTDGEDLVPAQMAQALQLELETKKAELSRVQADLDAKEKSIAELQTAASAQGGAESAPVENSAESAAMKEKLAELETKLAEYSIIEDDIADLCLYKEENTRLKEELERLKSGAAPAIGQASPDPTISVPETEAPSVAEAVTAPAEAAAPAVEAAPAAATDFELEQSEMDDLEAEFAAAVAAQKAEEAGIPAPEPAPEPEAPTGPDLTLVTGGQAPEEDTSQVVSGSAEPLAEELDTEKMMAEMASLNSVSSEEEDDIARILDADSDTDKMADEANLLNEPEPLKKGS